MNREIHEISEKRSSSFFVRMYRKFVAFIFAIFSSTRTGQVVLDDDSHYKNSKIMGLLKKMKIGRSSHTYSRVNEFFSKSRVAEFLKKLTTVVMSMSVQVYAIFFTVYGITSAVIHYALLFISEGRSEDVSKLIASVLILVLSIPFLASSKSLTEIGSTSLVLGGIVRSFLLVPEEHLKTKKRIGSTALMFIFAAFGLGAGLLTYFVNPYAAPIAFFAMLLFFIVMSFPESGVMMIAVTVPFLQYVQRMRILLPILVGVTCLSYMFKSLSGKRVGIKSSKGVYLAFFCAFIVIASTFSAGGLETFVYGLYQVILIIGGFYITFNLMKSEEKLRICTRCLVISFGVLVFMGIWDIVYGGGAADVLRFSLRDASDLISERIFYIADSTTNFGIIACFICPIIFCNAFSKKNISAMTLSLVCFAFAIAATLIYGTYESIVAIIFGILAYVIFRDRRSFTFFIIVLMITAITLILVFSFVPESLIVRFTDIAEKFIPVNSAESEVRDVLERDIWTMLKDGNLSGIGAGSKAFVKSFAPYASVVSQGADAPANLYLQVICSAGIGGLAVFCLFFGFVFKNAVGYILISTDKKIKRMTLAYTCSMASALMLGSVINLWSDIRMFYLFWMMTALLCGYTRLGREVEEKKHVESTYESDRVDTSVRFQN